jgi:hypothetical protein
MKRHEALLALAIAYAMLSAAAVWQFGQYGLAGAGLVLFVMVSVLNMKEGDDDA